MSDSIDDDISGSLGTSVGTHVVAISHVVVPPPPFRWWLQAAEGDGRHATQ
jgi:hypothetical protein